MADIALGAIAMSIMGGVVLAPGGCGAGHLFFPLARCCGPSSIPSFSLLMPINAKGSPCGSTPLEGFLCGSAHIAAGQPELHGRTRREKGIVVSVAPAGLPSGADVQFRPGSSGAQQAHKRTRASIAQRVPIARAVESQ